MLESCEPAVPVFVCVCVCVWRGGGYQHDGINSTALPLLLSPLPWYSGFGKEMESGFRRNMRNISNSKCFTPLNNASCEKVMSEVI
jgi:hypothetical protein